MKRQFTNKKSILNISIIFILNLTIVLFSGYSSVLAQNAIVTENALPGDPGFQECYQGSCGSFEGFATELGVNKDSTIHFKISGPNGINYSIKIYRLGYYGGDGARLVATLPGPYIGTDQSALTTDDLNTGMVSCDNWAESAHWDIPSTAISGIYQAIVDGESGNIGYITFIVRDDTSTSALLYKMSDGTWQAYNSWGGRNFYSGGISGDLGTYNHAVKLSYQRPFSGVGSQNFFGQAELPLIRWMEKNGYDVSYTTQLDMSKDANLSITPSMHKILISAGHDEYWSAECRTVWETARNNGVNLAFFSGNEIYWKTRWEDNMKTLVCFKEGTLGENNCGGACDPSDIWTGLWRDGCGATYEDPANFGGAVDGCNPENQLGGQISWVNGVGTMTVSDVYKNMRFWKNTEVADLGSGQSLSLCPNSLGSEWDQYQYAEFYPPGRILLSSTQLSGRTHNLSLYRHNSGALVFAAGTIRWSWGLYADHEGGPSTEDLNMKQAMVNLFAYMGVPQDPAYLEAGLFPETGASSNTPPSTVITSPVNGATLSSSSVMITGTASAPQDAVISGIEVSVDDGITWYPASGTTNWTFSWNPGSQGVFIIKVRGWDDLGNVEIPGSVGSPNCISITFNGSSVYSVFQPNQPGADPQNGSGGPLEVGMRFMSNIDGYITSLKYYKIAGTTGVHTGNLWANTGGATPLASVTFTNETSSGWQTATLATPFAITANTLYVVSYFSPSGQYPSSSLNYFTSDVVNGPLTAPATENGLYIYNATSAFPNSFTLTNYWVDVNFTNALGPDETPPSVITITPLNNATGVPILNNPSVTFSEAIDPTTVNSSTFILTDPGSNPIASTVSYDSGLNTATCSPDLPLAYSTTYTVTVVGGLNDPRIKDVAGNAMLSDYSWSFTTEVLLLPSISEHPVSQSTCSGSDVSFTSAAAGNPLPTLQWQISIDNGGTWSDIPGSTTSPYTFTATIGDNDNQYRAVWTNDSGSATSNEATLSVSIGITGTIGSINSDICPGDSFELHLSTASGQSPYTLVVNGKTYSDVTVGSTFATIPTANESIWDSSTIPSDPDNTGSISYELGVKFTPIANGFIKGVRFYKGIGNTGTHAGHLWTSGGILLASATFVNETTTGWQQVLFSSPIPVTANTTYVASYSDPAGHFSQDLNFFNTSTPVISANELVQTLPSTGNGMYSVTVGAFPNLTPPLLTNYWVDVVYTYSIQNGIVTNNLTSLSDNGTCTLSGSPISSSIININNTTAPIVTSPVFYNQGDPSVPLSATGINLLWYTNATGGIGSSTAPTPSTSSIGTTSYYVSQTENGCESPRASIDVVVTGESGWYDPNWFYRSPTLLTNSCTTTLSDYQILISLDNTFDFTKPKTDGSDIRFTDADGTTLIPFWIETWDISNQLAKIWIKIPLISVGPSMVYLYYGNEAGTSLSDGPTTFILFDDDWTAPNIWTNTGNPSVLNGIISFANGQSIESLTTFAPGNAMGYRANYIGAASFKWAGFIIGSEAPFSVLEVDAAVGTDLILANQEVGNNNKSWASLGPITNTYHVYELGWLSGETKAYIDHDSNPVGVVTTHVPSASLPVAINNYNDINYGFDVDWVYIRKFIECEPTSITGTEQTQCLTQIPLVISPVEYCLGASSVPLEATGSSLLWYTDASGGTGSMTAPTPSTAVQGTTSYYVSQTVNSCESDRAQINVIIVKCGEFKALLQGTYDTIANLMNTGLSGNIPLSQPYNVAPWNYNGLESVTIMDATVVDWVLVELRSDTETIFERKAALLLEDGSIVQYNNTSQGVHFDNAIDGDSYYVVIHHRNHMPVMTAVTNALDETLIDFTDEIICYGSPNAEIELGTETGVFGMISGDINSNGLLSYSGPENDRGLIIARIVEEELTSYINAVTFGYFDEDVLMDYDVKYIGGDNDRAVMVTNLSTLTGTDYFNSVYQSVVPGVTTKSGSIVDGPIHIFIDETNNDLQVKITTDELITEGIVDNVQFTLSWEVASNDRVMSILENRETTFGLYSQGKAMEYEGRMYLAFVSVIPVEIPDPFTVDDEVTLISFTKDQARDFGKTINIADNAYTNNHNGMYYISLLGKDHTGIIQTNTLGNTELQDTGLSIYPNPVSTGFVHVEMNLTRAQEVNITVMDLHGKWVSYVLIQVNAGISNNQINLKHMPKGMYFIKVQGDNLNVIQKLIIH